MSLREIDPYDYISEPESNICVAVLSYIFVISILPKIEKIPWNVCVASITCVIHIDKLRIEEYKLGIGKLNLS
jgi:hypothetical protein